MFSTNPFAALTAFVPAGALQGYLVLMAVAVALGTVVDLVAGRKARFFLAQRQHARAMARRRLGALETAAVTARTVATDIATFGEFCNPQRRISHMLMFYGFVLYLVTTVTLVFAYPGEVRPPAVLPALWSLGVLMNLVGGYWFFLLLRVNVVHDGQPPWRLVRADLFIVCLLASMTFALLFQIAATIGNANVILAFAGLYLGFTTLLFVTVPWSKFPHMFYKPVVAVQKRLDEASGASDLPAAATTATVGEARCPPSRT
jgi:hypothetical protein